MRRKVVQQGAGTLMISLPSKWVQKNSIKKGQELEITEDKAHLLINTGERDLEKSLQIKEKQVIRQTIGALYKAGKDRIKLNFADPSILGEVQESLRSFPRYRISSQGKNFCQIETIGEPRENLTAMLKKVSLLLVSISNDSLKAITKKDYQELNNIKFLPENDTLITESKRILAKKGYEQPGKKCQIYAILNTLEKIMQTYTLMLNYITKNKLILSKPTLNAYSTTNLLLQTLMEFLQDSRMHFVANFEKIQKNYHTRVLETLERANRREARVIHYLIGIVELTSTLVEPGLSLYF